MNIPKFVTWSVAVLWLGLAAESRAAEPGNNIVGIDRSGVVTAREMSTGRTFQFQVTDRQLLATLKIGQPVYADFTKLQVSVQPDGIEPCCNIVAAAPPATAGSAGRSAVDPLEPCCAVVANPALRRLGRIVVAYPEKVDAPVAVYRAGGTQSVGSAYGDAAFDLFPGTYDVTISGKRIAGVKVESAHDTQIKVGVLRVNASRDTRIDVLDAADKKSFASGYGTQVFGLPIGEVGVQISGQTEAVVIEAGQVTEF